MNKKKVDFTSGSIFAKLLFFAIPIIATNLLLGLYNAADMMIVSLSDEPNAVGAVGTAGPLVNLINNLCLGFSVGTNIIIARYIGSKNREDSQRGTHTALTLGAILGVASMLVGVFVSRPVLALMGNTGNVLELATKYTVIFSLGIPFIALTNVLVAVFRAKGDSKTPLIVLALSGLLNVILNLFFVLVVGLSVEGVALATMIANVFSFVILVIRLRTAGEYVELSIRKLGIHKRAMRDIFSVGIPSAIQGALYSISNLVIVSNIVALDTKLSPDKNLSPVLNGNAAQANLDGFIFMIISALSQAAATFISQNYGANQKERIKKGLASSYLLVVVLSIASSGLLLLFEEPLLALYGVVDGAPGTADALAFETCMTRALLVVVPYFVCGLMDIGTTAIRSIGMPITSFMITFSGAFVFRIFWSFVIFPVWDTIVSVYIAYPISWGAAAIVAFVFAVLNISKIGKAKAQNELNTTPC